MQKITFLLFSTLLALVLIKFTFSLFKESPVNLAITTNNTDAQTLEGFLAELKASGLICEDSGQVTFYILDNTKSKVVGKAT